MTRCFTRDNLIVLGILATAVAASIFAVYLPQGRKLQQVQGAIDSQKAALESQSQKASVVPDIVRQLQDMKKRYKDFDRRLPKQKELGGFLREISGNLAEEKLSNQLIEPGNPTREELFHTLPIIMRFRGSYLSLTSFLKRIDTMERLTRVQKLKVVGDPKEEGLNIEMQLNIYFNEG
jgi:Tfp pilus assembly protein PilO